MTEKRIKETEVYGEEQCVFVYDDSIVLSSIRRFFLLKPRANIHEFQTNIYTVHITINSPERRKMKTTVILIH